MQSSSGNVPWQYRRNPISGMQYTQQIVSSPQITKDYEDDSTNEVAANVNAKSPQVLSPKNNLNSSERLDAILSKEDLPKKFSFNSFILKTQPEAHAYLPHSKKKERENSMKVVEQAMAQFKLKLKDKQVKEKVDQEKFLTGIKNNEILHIAQLKNMKKMKMQNQEYVMK